MAKKFNLKSYQKISGDDHIERRLREQHKDAPDKINEKQLENYRATEPEVITEKQLEKKRTGEKDVLTEGRLNNDNSKFAIKYRNPEAYEGDINKLEEKRLLNDPVENEKYEDATNTRKEPKWWEGKKSPDGLKIAKTAAVGELDFSQPRWSDMSEKTEEGLVPDIDLGTEPDIEDDEEEFDIVEKKDEDVGESRKSAVIITKQKEGLEPTPFIYLTVHYEPRLFDNEDQIKTSILDKILEDKPELAGLINIDNINLKGFDMATVRLIGDELARAISTEEGVEEDVSSPGEVFQEISFEERDIAGTPMIVGSVKINVDIDEMNRDKIIRDVADFIESKHSGVTLAPDSLDLTKLDTGEVSFVIAKNQQAPAIQEEFPVEETSVDFPIEEASSNKNIVISQDLKKNPKK